MIDSAIQYQPSKVCKQVICGLSQATTIMENMLKCAPHFRSTRSS